MLRAQHKAVVAFQQRVARRIGRELHWWEAQRLEDMYFNQDTIGNRAWMRRHGMRLVPGTLDGGHGFLTYEAAEVQELCDHRIEVGAP